MNEYRLRGHRRDGRVGGVPTHHSGAEQEAERAYSILAVHTGARCPQRGQKPQGEGSDQVRSKHATGCVDATEGAYASS